MYNEQCNMAIVLAILGVVLIYYLFVKPPTKGTKWRARPSVSASSLNRREYFEPAEIQRQVEDKLKPVLDDKCAGNFIASNLLPKADPKFKQWSDLVPKGPLSGADMLLDPVKVIGYDTVGNHLKNASYDLRKEPPNPTQVVSPWINSTYGPDLMRKPLEDCVEHTMPKTRQH